MGIHNRIACTCHCRLIPNPVWTTRNGTCLVVLNLEVSSCTFMSQETAEAGVEFCASDSIHSVYCPLDSIPIVLDSYRYHAIRTFCVGKLIMTLWKSALPHDPQVYTAFLKKDRTSHCSDIVCRLQNVVLVKTSSLLQLSVNFTFMLSQNVCVCVCVYTHIKKVKQSHYRPRVTQRVPGS
jgi:hypothetical protein